MATMNKRMVSNTIKRLGETSNNLLYRCQMVAAHFDYDLAFYYHDQSENFQPTMDVSHKEWLHRPIRPER
ncbi:hypothetical protein DERF_011371 [Dermatophagoides farinae]|uniref:Uncharacterized protein n=1 Tax=Dermatophagoides farinae TaxID=6954 RepID=A0A922L0C4_DERFA|nr:hypothetical protein DERF_011371 [Dermatophagoides farinae]